MGKLRTGMGITSALRRFRKDHRGTMSVELVLVLPILFWAYVAMIVFYDAYRARMEAQAAALHVADVISRQPDEMTTAYLEGMNDVYDFLTTRNRDTRLRISSIMWDADSDEPAIAWSYGTRGLPSLLDLTVASIGSPDADENAPAPVGFYNLDNQLPVADLANRIPQVLPGEALILVEAFTLWRSPIISWLGFDFLNDTRLTPLAVTRPRFSPFIRFENDNDIFPTSPPDALPVVGTPPPPVEEEEEPVPPTTSFTVVDNDFNSGDTTGWSSNPISSTNTTSFLGPFGRETRTTPVTYQVNLGGQSSSARIEFDLFIINSWDGYSTSWARPEGEFLMLQVNGTSIAAEAFQMDPQGMMRTARRTVASRAEGVFTTQMTLVQSNISLWGGGWNDQIWRVVIDVENPAQTFTLGFVANLDEAIDNEAFGFLNFRITGERGSHGPAHFVPNANARVNEDLFSRFTTYSGCPDRRIAAPALTVTNSELSTTLRMLRRAAGTTAARNCIHNADGFIRSSASYVFHYTNNTSDVLGNRLRIRTQDNNRGSTCDATLLIRDPFGAWSYNDAISTGWSSWDYNAQINLGHAATGVYHIWLGNYVSGTCDTELRFERY